MLQDFLWVKQGDVVGLTPFNFSQTQCGETVKTRPSPSNFFDATPKPLDAQPGIDTGSTLATTHHKACAFRQIPR
jgi:hypothetical protein